ncbi:MAG TPA: tetratricopeptide repeat protein [Thermodesulfovibrionales bacterium]|nr:tetratricopeptide repeat protein [Thermodesulfovibrionales bacterium]
MGKSSRRKRAWRYNTDTASGAQDISDNRQSSGKGMAQERRDSGYLLAGIVSLITFFVYLPSLRNEFVAWDDEVYVTNNPFIRSFSLDLFRSAFLEFRASNWHPLTWISHALDYAIFGLIPAGHHLTNIILHAVSTALVVLISVRLIGLYREKSVTNEAVLWLKRQGILITAGVTGLLFGLHPIHVESVAWVAERKDLLCAVFFLLSILAYTKYVGVIDNESVQEKLNVRFLNRHYLFAVGFFVLALLSKPMAVSLPVVLLILDWCPLGRIKTLKSFLAALVEKGPFVTLSLLSSIVTIQAQKAGGAMGLMGVVPLSTRVLVAAKSVLAYLWKMIVPVNLIPYYPYPHPGSVAPFSAEYLLAIVVVLGITAACVAAASNKKFFLAAWSYYLITVLPVLGIVQVGEQAMADRYMYLPSLSLFLIGGLVIAFGWIKANALRRNSAMVKLFGVSVFMSLSIAMVYLTFEQIGVWKDGMTLWSYVIGKEPESVPFAYINRGKVYYNMGKFDEAIEDFDKANALNPSYHEAYNNRGVVFGNMGRFDKALEDFDRTIALNPSYYEAYNNRGKVYYKMGKFDKALEEFGKTIALNPSYTLAYTNRGQVFYSMGMVDKAMSDFQKACDLGDRKGCAVLQTLTRR